MADCRIKDCFSEQHTRGLCRTHYEWLKDGRSFCDAMQVQHHGLSIIERFNRWWKEDSKTGCWLWQGSLNPQGYGQFNMGKGRPILAHRAGWELYKGAIPENARSAYKTFYLCHKCDNPKCVNPEHMFLGDQTANMADMHGKGRGKQGVSLGVNHGMSKCNPDLVREIRASSESTLALSRKYGLSRPTIDQIRQRKTWKHIE